MDQTQANEIVQSLTVADIKQAYSGKPGCACGCNGNYYCTPESPCAKDGDKVNVRMVTKVLRMVQAAAADDPYVEDLNMHDRAEVCWNVADDLQYVTATVTPKRVYTIYLMSDTRKRLGVTKGYDL